MEKHIRFKIKNKIQSFLPPASFSTILKVLTGVTNKKKKLHVEDSKYHHQLFARDMSDYTK